LGVAFLTATAGVVTDSAETVSETGVLAPTLEAVTTADPT
jgi:hypothetical protein